MSFKLYLKRGYYYIAHDWKPQVVKAEVVQGNFDVCLRGKTMLITGGGRGIGFYIAKRFAEEGAKVIITGRDEKNLQKSVQEIGKSCEYRVFDVTNYANGEKLIDELFRKYGRIDCLVNNAGVSFHEKGFLDVDEKGMMEQFQTNFFGGYFLTQHYLKKYIREKQEKGNVIFMSSERGDSNNVIPYGLTKVAINNLVRGLSKEFYKKGVRVNAIAPGVTTTDMTGKQRDDLRVEAANSGRNFVPEEVAEVAVWLASDFSECVSGEIVHTNAGNHLIS